jgi:hypothetical protein
MSNKDVTRYGADYHNLDAKAHRTALNVAEGGSDGQQVTRRRCV